MNTQQVISTDNVTGDEHGNISFQGREAVNAYAFLVLRRSVILRTKTGMSLCRNQEAPMARNYGWSNRSKWSPALLDDLNKIGDAAGIARAK